MYFLKPVDGLSCLPTVYPGPALSSAAASDGVAVSRVPAMCGAVLGPAGGHLGWSPEG